MSNELVTIKELLDLPEKFFIGQSDISLEATLKNVLKARHIISPEGSVKKYDFYSQFIVVEDGTGDIGMDATAPKEEDTIPSSAIGKKVQVSGAKTDIYKDKAGKDVRKLTKGKVILLEPVDHTSPEKEDSGNGKDKVPQEVWQKKDRLIAREALAKALIVAGYKGNDETKAEADWWFGWVNEEVIEPANVIEEIKAPESDMLEEEPPATKAQKNKITELAGKLGYKTIDKKPIEKVLPILDKKKANSLIAWLIKEKEGKLSNRINELIRELEGMVNAGEVDGKAFDDVIMKRFEAKTDEQKEELIKELEGILKK